MAVTRPACTILAVGAAGPFAGLVVPELAKRGAHVRALIRDARQGEMVRAHGAAEIAIGDLRDRASLDAALAGVDAVFSIAPAFMAGEAAVGTCMIEAVRRAPLRVLVRHRPRPQLTRQSPRQSAGGGSDPRI